MYIIDYLDQQMLQVSHPYTRPNNVLDHAAEVVPGIYIGSVDSAMLASMPDYPVRIDAIVDLSGYTYTTSIISLHILMNGKNRL